MKNISLAPLCSKLKPIVNKFDFLKPQEFTIFAFYKNFKKTKIFIK